MDIRTGRPKPPPWSEAEKEFVRQNYDRLTLQDIGDKLGRSREAVAKMANVLGLKKNGRQSACHPARPHYAHGLCRLCYVKQNSVEAKEYEASAEGKQRQRRYDQSGKGRERKRRYAEKRRLATGVPDKAAATGPSDREVILDFARKQGDWFTISDLRVGRRRFRAAADYPREKVLELFRAIAQEGLGEVQGSKFRATSSGQN